MVLTFQGWRFQRSSEDKPRSGQPKKFEDKELEALEEDQNQMQEELAESLG